MIKVIVDYSTNRLIDHGKFLFERKVTTLDIANHNCTKEELHTIAKQSVIGIEQTCFRESNKNKWMYDNKCLG
ncbi:hypothetical protein SAMN04488542_10580 [Fontibacillus panacisegetis]|uniref:Uncharacterized protein n=1 Tax=Fontibacillus panacisegetis TaxID=670482 RepID=A0A1G7HY69_9BACL|nr:hypothetical protein SAMN04488542_10580 [Fontibacillus panacisegetis]